jgi:hypothetical protein
MNDGAGKPGRQFNPRGYGHGCASFQPEIIFDLFYHSGGGFSTAEKPEMLQIKARRDIICVFRWRNIDFFPVAERSKGLIISWIYGSP